MIVCKRLKELRLYEKKTQQELADLLEIDQSSYSKYERGKLEINLEMLIKLSKYFDVTTDYLLGLED